MQKGDMGFSFYLGPGTNQQAELIALTKALQYANDGDEILTDSQYALGMAKGWKPKLNLHYVLALRVALKGKRVALTWVRGHAGDRNQEMADSLANQVVIDHAALKQTIEAGAQDL